MYGTPAVRRRSTAASVFASCMRASVPSCMRAPPEAETTISGMRSARAASAARATFSPTTDPMEPPMNPKSRAQIATRVPWTAPVPQTAASFSPVALCASVTRSGYALRSTKPSGSTETRPGSRSTKLPSSRSCASRVRAEMRKWWPHEVQTRRFLSRCLLNSISWQSGHCVQRSTGYGSFRARKDGSFNGIRRSPSAAGRGAMRRRRPRPSESAADATAAEAIPAIGATARPWTTCDVVGVVEPDRRGAREGEDGAARAGHDGRRSAGDGGETGGDALLEAERRVRAQHGGMEEARDGGDVGVEGLVAGCVPATRPPRTAGPTRRARSRTASERRRPR